MVNQQPTAFVMNEQIGFHNCATANYIDSTLLDWLKLYQAFGWWQAFRVFFPFIRYFTQQPLLLDPSHSPAKPL